MSLPVWKFFLLAKQRKEGKKLASSIQTNCIASDGNNGVTKGKNRNLTVTVIYFNRYWAVPVTNNNMLCITVMKLFSSGHPLSYRSGKALLFFLMAHK